MGLRPISTHWFEILVPGGHVARAAEVLARTGHVQIESAEELVSPAGTELASDLERFAVLAGRYGPYWPHPRDTEPASSGLPQKVLADAFLRLESWAESADPCIAELQRREHEIAELALLRELIEYGEGILPDLDLLSGDRNSLTVQILQLPPGSPPLQNLPPARLRRTIATPSHLVELIVASTGESERIERAADAAKARRMVLPRWLPAIPQEALAAIEERRTRIEQRMVVLREDLSRLAEEHRLRQTLTDIHRLEWYATQISGTRHTRNFAVLTGWTDEPTGDALVQALRAADLHALLRFASPPKDRTPPVIVSNPGWARPFELFSRMLGVPATGEVDPAVVLSLVAPLIFGYMFGDVGQGAVLLAMGILLRKRYPFLRILIGGGLAAMAFGLVFGSFFAREDVVPALWIRPMDAPLHVLLGSIGLGAAVLMLGILLHGLSALWRRELGTWLRIDLPVALIYVGVLGLFVDARLAWVAVAGGALAVVLQLGRIAQGASAVFGQLGEILEQLMRIGVNTVSFVRVGAFALAHAGLATAVVSLADGAGGPLGHVVILVLGNALILVLEGVVVSIQTTRLILFEFFVRFLKAEGRPFSPLLPPPSDGASHATTEATPTRNP